MVLHPVPNDMPNVIDRGTKFFPILNNQWNKTPVRLCKLGPYGHRSGIVSTGVLSGPSAGPDLPLCRQLPKVIGTVLLSRCISAFLSEYDGWREFGLLNEIIREGKGRTQQLSAATCAALGKFGRG